METGGVWHSEPGRRSLIPDPNVGMPRFCYAYPIDVNGTNTQTCPPDADCVNEPTPSM